MVGSKESIAACYVITDVELLCHSALSDIKVKSRGNVVELWLYYLPKTKYDIYRIKKLCYKESQFILTRMKDGYFCAKFLAPSKYANLLICEMALAKPNLGERKILEYVKQKTRATYNK